ncbi:hypothetical protein [Asinibacterium sp. OR53]|uniref:hypothetical protein n=1 Tax=Asinibacterium sp. OR53 TaxID=925409 RepID=UPI00047BF150|nr:hypothetical protein [Asinibacterium sp. OR53]
MKKSILILSVLGYIAFISCNKTEISSLQKSNNSEVLKKTKNYIIPGPCPYSCSDQRCMNYESGYCGYIPVINNPNNPYNYVGPNHNNGMDYSIPKINPSSPTLESDILNTTKAYVQTLGYNPNDFQSTYDQGVANGYFPFYKTPDLDSLGIIMTL